MLVNEIGLAILLWTGLAALLVFYMNRTWSEVIQRPKEAFQDWVSAIFAPIKQWPDFFRPALVNSASLVQAEDRRRFFSLAKPESDTGR